MGSKKAIIQRGIFLSLEMQTYTKYLIEITEKKKVKFIMILNKICNYFK